MHKLTRKQVYLAPVQAKRVKRRAKEEGVAEAEIIRRALELGLNQLDEALDATQRKARKSILAAIDARTASGVSEVGRSWTRDELYDDRVKR